MLIRFFLMLFTDFSQQENASTPALSESLAIY